MSANETGVATESGARDRILNRVREAMRHKAPPIESHGEPRPWFPAIPSDPETLVARFREEMEMLKGEFLRAKSEDDARRQLAEFCARNAIQKIAASDEPLLRQALAGRDVSWLGPETKAGKNLDPFDLGVTRADALAARTGSILLSARSGTGRALSVLPPIHLVVARREELVADLADGIAIWRRQYGADWPSNCFVITGPSRTADIEKVLVLGAHGPKRLVTLLLG
jgi:L-lactate dehydrogenase complex protein LldG